MRYGLGGWLIIFMTTACLGAGNDRLEIYAQRLSDAYASKSPIDTQPDKLAPADGQAVQRLLLNRLRVEWGPIVGYKAALTNPSIQRKFGVDHPLRGALLQRMLLPSGAEIPARFGARPRLEGDLIVRVGDAAINEAETPVQLAAGLNAVIPFIELPDLLFATNVNLTASWMIAMNAGARLGIMGEPIPFPDGADRQAWLNAVRVRLENKAGELLAAGLATDLLGDPLNAVRWLRDSLKADGVLLKPGDFLSLGSMTRLLPVTPRSTVIARYFNLDPARSIDVSVKFTP